eukprot:scaffold151762_cov41-Tisochrysis_lutea.AAC.1
MEQGVGGHVGGAVRGGERHNDLMRVVHLEFFWSSSYPSPPWALGGCLCMFEGWGVLGQLLESLVRRRGRRVESVQALGTPPLPAHRPFPHTA